MDAKFSILKAIFVTIFGRAYAVSVPTLHSKAINTLYISTQWTSTTS